MQRLYRLPKSHFGSVMSKVTYTRWKKISCWDSNYSYSSRYYIAKRINLYNEFTILAQPWCLLEIIWYVKLEILVNRKKINSQVNSLSASSITDWLQLSSDRWLFAEASGANRTRIIFTLYRDEFICFVKRARNKITKRII